MNREAGTQKQCSKSTKKNAFSNLAFSLRPFELVLIGFVILLAGIGFGALIDRIIVHLW